MDKYTKKIFKKNTKIVMKCIGLSIGMIFMYAYFFVPGMLALFLLAVAIFGDLLKGIQIEPIIIPIIAIYIIVCIGYACYTVGEENR